MAADSVDGAVPDVKEAPVVVEAVEALAAAEVAVSVVEAEAAVAVPEVAVEEWVSAAALVVESDAGLVPESAAERELDEAEVVAAEWEPESDEAVELDAGRALADEVSDVGAEDAVSASPVMEVVDAAVAVAEDGARVSDPVVAPDEDSDRNDVFPDSSECPPHTEVLSVHSVHNYLSNDPNEIHFRKKAGLPRKFGANDPSVVRPDSVRSSYQPHIDPCDCCSKSRAHTKAHCSHNGGDRDRNVD